MPQMVRSLSSRRWFNCHTGNCDAPFSIVSFGRMFSDRVRGNIMVVRPYSELSDIGQVETGGIYRTLAFGFQLQVCRVLLPHPLIQLSMVGMKIQSCTDRFFGNTLHQPGCIHSDNHVDMASCPSLTLSSGISSGIPSSPLADRPCWAYQSG